MAKQISEHFTTGQLIVHTLPTIATMIFASIYGIVDGFFITNWAGKTAFAAVNLIMPFIMILGSIGFMMGAGGTAIVARTYGEGDQKLAQQRFSLFVAFTAVMGTVFAIVGALFMEPVALLLGSNDAMLETCVLYGRISMISLPFFMLQYSFQSFFSAAGKQRAGFIVTLAAGITNMFLDFLFVGVFGWGVMGAAIATVTSEIIGGGFSLIYFARKNSSYLKLVRPKMDWRSLGSAMVNGSSEMVASVAMSIVSIVYNLQLMRLIGEEGVAAYGVIMYVAMIFAAVFEGYCVGASPLMSYQHGARNVSEKRSVLKKSLAIVCGAGALMLAASQLLAVPLAALFTSYDQELFELTKRALSLYALAFVFMGPSMYGSALFTSLGNGPISALISLLRTFVFEIGSVLLLPIILGNDGIWLAVVVAEFASMLISAFFLWWLGPHYELFDSKRKRRIEP